MPAVTRGPNIIGGVDQGDGDLDVIHCTLPRRKGMSSTVFVNASTVAGVLGRGVSRRDDLNTIHLFPAVPICLPHVMPISFGSLTVFADGLGIGRVGDDVGSALCTFVAEGSADVFAG